MNLTRLGILIAGLAASLTALLAMAIATEQFQDGPNYTRVETGLYVGGSVKTPPFGTQAVLNLCELEDSYKCDVHVWAKIRDSAPAPKLEWLAEQVEWIARQRRAGRTTYVHCLNGMSRAPTVVTAYLMAKHGLTRDLALKRLREVRSVRPNPAFMDLLADWERALKAQNENLPRKNAKTAND